MKATVLFTSIILTLVVVSGQPLLSAAVPLDFGISFGHVAQYDDYHTSGLSTHLGLVKGLTERLELLVFVQTELTPDVFGDAQIGVDLAYSLMGKRWDKDGFAGMGVNMLVSIGILAGVHSQEGLFGLDSIVAKLTPIAMGTAHVGKRNRFCTFGIDWNIRDNKVAFIWNILISDFYIRGTWRDDPALRFSH